MSAIPATFTWQLTAFEYHGNLWLKWNTTAPFRAQQGQIHIYSGDFPSNPTDNTVAWQWDNDSNNGWDTGQRWGIGWSCAWIAQASPNGPYVYVDQVVTDTDMGPDAARV
jgi:hypothetical protein